MATFPLATPGQLAPGPGVASPGQAQAVRTVWTGCLVKMDSAADTLKDLPVVRLFTKCPVYRGVEGVTQSSQILTHHVHCTILKI